MSLYVTPINILPMYWEGYHLRGVGSGGGVLKKRMANLTDINPADLGSDTNTMYRCIAMYGSRWDQQSEANMSKEELAAPPAKCDAA